MEEIENEQVDGKTESAGGSPYIKPTVKKYEVYETSALGGSCAAARNTFGDEDCIQTS